MVDPEICDLWTATGLILGFQVTLLWRLEREAQLGDEGDIPWLVPADYVSIVGMLSFVVGVVLLPVLGPFSFGAARAAFGLGALLFVGQALGLAGHYQLFNRSKTREHVWFPLQEKVVVGLTTLFSAAFLGAVWWM
jgi:hypothetical protein